MYLNKKQKKAIRKAIRKAIDIMSTILGNGLDSDEDGEIDFALEQLIKMTDSSYKQNNQERCWEE